MNKKVKFLSVAASMALAASLGTPALAAGGGVVPVTGGTDVYAGVTTNADASKTNLKVTVPTLFSFVVVGADSSSGGTAVSVSNGNLLLPNVKVDGNGKVSTVGQSQLTFTNYSTKVDGSSYAGLGVNINGMVSTEAGSQWTYVPAAREDGGPVTLNKYEYNLSLGTVDETGAVQGEQAFNEPQGENGYACKTGITLTAPTVSTADDVNTDNTAKVGKTQVVSLGVNVGGNNTDYKTAEASAKVGTIVWTITPNS